MAGEMEIFEVKTQVRRIAEAKGCHHEGRRAGLGDMGGPPAPTLPRDRAEPHSPKPHSFTKEPQLFLWTHFNLTKSANY